MHDRRRAASAKVHLTADVGGRNHLGIAGVERVDLAIAKRFSQLALQQRVAACGAAAQVGVGDLGEFKSSST